MARGRVPLTDKEERILVQAQLMGLSTQSMVKIGNRLRALENEREEMRRIAETTQGYVWDDITTAEKIKITTPDGLVLDAVRGSKGRTQWSHSLWTYTITATKPGTRFKPRVYKKAEIRCDNDWTKKLMPAKSKELYGLIQWHRNRMDWDTYENP